MYFSLQESGELLQGENAPASGLYFDCAELPADWYAQLKADFDAAPKPEEPKEADFDAAPKPEEPKKATPSAASKAKPAPSA